MSDKQPRIAKVELQRVVQALDQYPGLDDFVGELVEPIVNNVYSAKKGVQQVLAALTELAQVVDVTAKNANNLDAFKADKPFTSLGQFVNLTEQMQLPDTGALLENLTRLLISVRQSYTNIQEAAPQVKKEYEALSTQAQQLVQDEPAVPEAPAAPAYDSSSSTGPEGVQYEYEGAPNA